MSRGGCAVDALIADKLFRIRPRALPASAATKECAVIFVHGFLGDASTTWIAEGSSDSFPALLVSDPELSDQDVFTFQYRTRQLSPPAIKNISAQLRFAVEQHIKASRIVLIAHSMGGLVCMDYIIWLLENEEARARTINGLLLFGTPMTGVEWANYAKLVLQLGQIKIAGLGLLTRVLTANKQVTALSTGSQEIESLLSGWILRVLNGGNPETRADQRAWFPVRVVSGNDDWVVKESSARGLYANRDWINVDEDHRAMVKPATRGEMSYQIATAFIHESRQWMNPRALLKLRRQLDAISNVRPTKYISNWIFRVECDGDELSERERGFGLAECRTVKISECSYRLRLTGPYLMFGIALGSIDAAAIWNDSFAFLYTIGLEGLPEDQSSFIRQRFKAAIAQKDGWERVFDEVKLSVRRNSADVWLDLEAGEAEALEGGLVRRFSVPATRPDLVGPEIDIRIGFKSLTPSAITNYTVSFPWLCDSFVFGLTVAGSPSYLVATRGMKGSPDLKDKREGAGRIQYSSEDLILPGSFLRFEWKFRGGEG